MFPMNTEAAKAGLRMDSMDTSMKSDVEALKAEIARLREDLAATAKTAASLGKHGFDAARERAGTALESAKERVHDTAEAARQRAAEAAHYAREKGREGVEKAETTIKDHPLQSVAIAFGAGLLLGALLRSSK
jgi:ElaB/YqjD/DUF883 family membrane-anchored ribosome-binding protein